MSVLVLTTDNFNEVVDNNPIVFVDFWAKWCQPCLAFADTYAEIAAQHKDIVFASVNVEEQSALAKAFQIQSIPFLLVLKETIAIFAEAGTMPESTLEELISQARQVDVTEIKQSIAPDDQQD